MYSSNSLCFFWKGKDKLTAQNAEYFMQLSMLNITNNYTLNVFLSFAFLIKKNISVHIKQKSFQQSLVFSVSCIILEVNNTDANLLPGHLKKI